MDLIGCPISDHNRGITKLEPLQAEYEKEEEGKNVNLENTIQEKTKLHSDEV